jgi:hypothetical protein
MKQGFLVALVAACCLMAAARLSAQAAPGGDGTGTGQSSPAANSQKPAAPLPKQGANPFPEDTSNFPVMPSKGTPALPEGTYGEENGASERLALPAADVDPVRSPDDPGPGADKIQELESSSSRAGMDKLLPGTDDDDQPQGKRRKLAVKAPEHRETSAEDIEVGKYEMDRKNWKAALSRFESAMVLAPDEPEVYWGLAESQRNLGRFAEARTYYLKLLDYDPDGPHAKAARKALKDPEVANAKAAAPGQPVK